jgi:hypothetical protein
MTHTRCSRKACSTPVVVADHDDEQGGSVSGILCCLGSKLMVQKFNRWRLKGPSLNSHVRPQHLIKCLSGSLQWPKNPSKRFVQAVLGVVPHERTRPRHPASVACTTRAQ